MKSFILLLAILYLVNAKSLYDNEDSENNENTEHHSLRQRHRRRSREPYYDPYNPYYDNRLYYGRQQEDTLIEIHKLLQELATYVKRPPPPPPPPQIIYIPIPYQTPSLQNFSLGSRSGDRWVFGLVPGNTGTNMDDGNDGNRPISLTPAIPKEPVPDPPPVEHGSSQAGITPPPTTTTTTTTTTEAPAKKSLVCQAAIIICCDSRDDEKRKQCFKEYGCSRTYATGYACHRAVIKRAYEEFTNAYANDK